MFNKVLKGKMTREEVSEWASYYIVNDDIHDIRDIRLWKLLEIASGIDIKDGPNEYLHSAKDIEDWLKL